MSIEIDPSVRLALSSGRAVVALETAVVTHGLPRLPMVTAMDGWDSSAPANRELAALLHRGVRAVGAVPAMITVMDGSLCVGMDEDQVHRLAADLGGMKASARDLAFAMATGKSAGTTVAGTLAACGVACGVASGVAGPRIRVFATGGIGGVHRGWNEHPDVSADLVELSRSPMCVVCSGAKSILDVPATVEALDTLGVPVIGWRTEWFPKFFSRGEGGIRLATRCEKVEEIAAVCREHWVRLGRSSAVVVVNPVPREWEIGDEEIESVIARADEEARREGIRGGALTPFLLERVNALTGSRSLAANVALLESNARLAGEIAVAMEGVEFERGGPAS